MNKTVYWAAGALLAITLTGCAAAAPEPLVDKAPVSQPAEQEPSTAPTLEAAPPSDAETLFDISIRLVPGLADVDAATALAVGYDVCAKLTEGISPLDILPVPASDQDVNEEVVRVAALTLCTEYNESTQATFVDRRVNG